MSEGKLLLALFSYVKANEAPSNPRDWTSAQYEEMQLQALASLCTLGPLLVDDYMTCQGSTRLLLMLEWSVSQGLCLYMSCKQDDCLMLVHSTNFLLNPLILTAQRSTLVDRIRRL